MAEQITIDFQTFWLETCYKCEVPFAMDDKTYKIARERREGFSFHCPHGHGQIYTTGDSAITKMRRERDRLKQDIAYKDDEIIRQRDIRETAERRASAFKGQVTKLKNRASAGVCACCNRHFTNLQRHMETKHPDYAKEEAVG